MTKFARICGIVGGVVEIAAAAWFLSMAVWKEKHEFDYGFWLAVFFATMGVLALTANTLGGKIPLLARALIGTSIAGIFLASMLDAPALWILFWPGMVLLIPAAVELSKKPRGNR